jgi:cytochrome c556
MTKSSQLARPALALLAAFLLLGCGPTKNDPPANPPPPPPGQAPPGNAGAPSGIKQVMAKIGRGPQSLSAQIGQGLNANPPPWDALQPQTKDLTQQATALEAETPIKGAKETWDKHAKDFADLAAALDAAVQAKDQAKAKDAHGKLGQSCNDCHRDHRGGRPGPGG